jgi:hypothetical protein
MKSINKYFAFLLIALIGVGCNKKLDVKPQQNITPEQIVSGDDVKAVLFGAYSRLQGPGGYGEGYFVTADLLASPNHIVFVGTFADYEDLSTRGQINSNLIAEGLWANSYDIINIVNTVLEKSNLIEDADEKAEIEAEAKFIRGIVYFELAKFFGKPYAAGNITSNLAVPLVTLPVYKYVPADHHPARNTVEQVYTRILTDLTDASVGLPEVGSNFRAGKFAAYAFLSRVYLSMRNWQKAAQAADMVIDSSDHFLNSSFPGAFNNANNSPEDIFAIQQTSQSNSGTNNNGINTFYASNDLAPPLLTGRGDIQVHPNYYSSPQLFEPTDIRGQFFYEGASIGGTGGVYTGKWQQFYKAIPVVRLAEMYLTRGEANLRNGTNATGGELPVDDINEVRKRAGASLMASVVANDFIEERFRELAFEGDRLWTLKRMGLPVGNTPADSLKLVLPIPLRELDVNKNLVQNQGY